MLRALRARCELIVPFVNNAITFQVMFVKIATSEGADIIYLIYFNMYLKGFNVYNHIL